MNRLSTLPDADVPFSTAMARLSAEPVVVLDRVTARRGEVEALSGVSLTIRRGDFLAVIGPNGGGKTTLLKVILGLVQPEFGTVSVFGGPAGRSTAMGYVPQSAEASRDFPATALDVALMGRLGMRRRFFGDRKRDLDKARAALALTGMEGLEKRRVGELSGGQRQRVLIARAMAAEPELLLLDEPTNGVDAKGREELYAVLRRLNERMTIVLVSHEIGVVDRCVKSVACVDRCLHYHPAPEVTPRMFSMLYGGACPDECPVEVFAHGMPHRVVEPHDAGDCPRCASGRIGRASGQADFDSPPARPPEGAAKEPAARVRLGAPSGPDGSDASGRRTGAGRGVQSVGVVGHGAAEEPSGRDGPKGDR